MSKVNDPNFRQFYRTLITFEVLHEHPLPDGIGLGDVVREATEGAASGMIQKWDTTQVSGKIMAKLLQKQGSEPEFFSLNPDGTLIGGDENE